MSNTTRQALESIAATCILYFLSAFYSAIICVLLPGYAILNRGKKFSQNAEPTIRPNCLLNLNYGSHRYANVNNINIHYVEKGDRNKPLMLFIHGFPEFWFSWRHQIEEFSNDYWTVALDLRGFGDSDRPSDPSNYRITNMIEDVRQLVNHLGKDKFILVAHDWGGVIAWNFLDLHSDMVSQFIIMGSPHCRTWKSVMLSNFKQFILSWYVFFFQMPVLPEFVFSMNNYSIFDGVFGDGEKDENDAMEVRQAYKHMFSRPGAMKSAIDYYRINFCKITVTEEAAKSLPDGLFIHDDGDAYIVEDYLETAKATIPNLQTLVLKNCNHFLQQSSFELVNATMRTFLNKPKSADALISN